jgi:hypothetical protein
MKSNEKRMETMTRLKIFGIKNFQFAKFIVVVVRILYKMGTNQYKSVKELFFYMGGKRNEMRLGWGRFCFLEKDRKIKVRTLNSPT